MLIGDKGLNNLPKVITQHHHLAIELTSHDLSIASHLPLHESNITVQCTAAQQPQNKQQQYVASSVQLTLTL